MLDYIDEIRDAFDKLDPTGGGTNSSAAPAIICKVDEDCKNLHGKRTVEFHHLVGKMIFANKRARPNIYTAISFLIKRLIESNNDDWSKLFHLMKYIKIKRNLPLILSANKSGILKWWIDGTFAVHPSMRGHTVGGLSM